MPIEITIPRLGWNMEEGVFHGWLRQDGDTVRAGDLLYSLESDKATQEIECLESGVLGIAPGGPKAGDTIAVGTVIGYLLGAGEEIPGARAATPTASISEAIPEARAPKQDAVAERATVGIAISPRAKRIAAELGVNLITLKGTGRTGRIREKDVRANAEPHTSSVRKSIAAHMRQSVESTAPVTLTTTADATNLVKLRNRLKTQAGVTPSYTDFLVKLTATALQNYSQLHSQWRDGQIVAPSSIHIGIAVDTKGGLLVPVIRDAAALSVGQIAERARDLIDRARRNKLKPADLQGGTFTITNLGSFGIDAFTPIINYPECAILGVGRIVRQPVVENDQIVIRDRVTLSLTFDHRIVDGAPAARFLQRLVKLIENPEPWLSA